MYKPNVTHCSYYTQVGNFNIIGNEKHQQIVLTANVDDTEIKVSCLIPEKDQIDVRDELPSTVLQYIKAISKYSCASDREVKLGKITTLEAISKELDIAWVKMKISSTEKTLKYWKNELQSLEESLIVES